jgi:hypothetical protein
MAASTTFVEGFDAAVDRNRLHMLSWDQGVMS